MMNMVYVEVREADSTQRDPSIVTISNEPF